MTPVTAGPSHPSEQLPQPLRRSRSGRWLGGVCSGMAARWGTPVGQLRALFVAAALFAGLGILAYAACWLVLPTDEDDDSPSLLRGVASVALLVAALAGLATLALLACAATLFGFGWTVVVAGAVFLAGALVAWPAASPAWVLLPLVSVALPAVLVGASGVRIASQAGLVQAAPRTPAEIPSGGYEAGLGELFVDLRDFRASRDAVVPLRLDTGVGRTVVALPRDRCFNLEVRYDTGTRGWELVRTFANALQGRGSSWIGTPIYLYGEQQSGGNGRWSRPSRDPHAPTLRVDFSSIDGELWLRDYPRGVGPLYQYDWPYVGYSGPDDETTPARLDRKLRGACAPAAPASRRAPRRDADNGGARAPRRAAATRAPRPADVTRAARRAQTRRSGP